MNSDYELVISPLSRLVTEKSHTVQVDIYRGLDTGWTLEVVDEFGNSTVWDDTFTSDKAALDEALRTIRDEGIESLIGLHNGDNQ